MDIQDFMVDRDQHMRPLEYDLSENFNELLRYMQDMGILDNVPVGTTSESEIVSISDAYPAPPRALTVYGKSTQAGTPTPDAPVPILSVDDLALVCAGKNLLRITGTSGSHGGIMYTVNADKTIVASGTESSTGYPFDIGTVKVKAGLTYHLSGCPAGGSTGTYRVYPANKPGSWYDTGNGATFTPTADETLTIRIVIGGGTYSNLVFKPQLELGSTATAYEPYQDTTVPDLLPEGTDLRSLQDGTRDQLNLNYLRPSTRAGWAWYSRELVQRVNEAVFDETYNWSRNAGTEVSTGSWRFECNIGYKSQPISIWGNTNAAVPAYCDHLKAAPTGGLYSGWVNCFGMYQSRLYVRMSGITTVDELTAWLAENPLTIQYPVAPTTTQLDPIELPTLPAPTATVWCDGGSATPTLVLEYIRDANAALTDLSEAIADIVSG